MIYFYNLLNFIYTSSISIYLFFYLKILFISSIFLNTLLVFQLGSQQLKRKLRRRLKGKRTILSWVFTFHPRLWIIISTIMIHKWLPTPTSVILQQFQSSHDRINLLHNRVILSRLVVFDFQLQKFQQLFTTPIITKSNNNPTKPNNLPPTNFFNFDDIVTPSTDVDCSFLDETSDFISPQGYKAITENGVNSFMDCSSGMIDWFPVVFDSGASLVIVPCKDHFVGEIIVPDKPLRLGGLALGLPINGKGIVEWSLKTATEDIVIRTQAYYVPNCNVCLLSPQRLFKKDKGIIGEFTCREEHASLQFQGVPNIIIDYDSRSKLPIALGKNKEVSAHQINLCVTDDDNQNPTPSQKTLLQWHYRFGHKHCASLQTMFRSEPFTFHKFLPASRCELP